MLELTDVVLTVGATGDERVLLRGAHLRVDDGETVVLSGLDAITRRALIRLLTGHVKPNYGRVVVDKHPVVPRPTRRTVLLDAGDRVEPDVLRSKLDSADSRGGVVVLAKEQPQAVDRGAVRRLELSGGRFLPLREKTAGSVHIPLVELADRVNETLRAAGATPEAAATVTRVLVDAERRGHRSHGVALLPTYLKRIAAGGIVVTAEPRLSELTPAIASVDAQGGLGQPGMDLAAEWCARVAGELGLAAVAVHDNNHVGMLAAYREPFQEHQVIGFLLNTSGPSVAAPRAPRATLGSNAVCLVTPGAPGGEPFCVDMATGVVAAGKIRDAVALGLPVPDGWLLDSSGKPTTDPTEFDAGGSIPLFGDYKGLCVTLLAEILAGALAGGRVSPDVAKQRKQLGEPMRCSQLLVGLSVRHFGEHRQSPHELVDRLREAVLAGYDTPPARPWFPDQLEEDNADRADLYGVPVAVSVLDELGWGRS